MIKTNIMGENLNKVVEVLRMCWRYDVTTAAGRRVQSVKIIGVAMIAIIGLLIFLVEDVHEARENIQQANSLEENVNSSLQVASLIHRLQIERGLTVWCLGSDNEDDRKKVFQKLNTAREKTDQALMNTAWPFTEAAPEDFLRGSQSFRKHLNKHRYEVGQCEHGTLEEQIQFYTLPIELMLNWFHQTVKENSKNIIFMELIGYHMFIAGKDKIGIERALGGTFYARGHFNESSHLLWFANYSILGRDYLASSSRLVADIKTTIDREVNRTVLGLIAEQRDVIFSNRPGNSSVQKGEEWFNLMTSYLDDLFKVQEEAGMSLFKRLNVQRQKNTKNLTQRLSFLVFSLILVPLLVCSVYRMTGTIQNYTFQLAQATLQLQEEKTRADTLLYQMFPHPVAELLKNNQQIPAEFFSSVTVFFSDIVNFTEMCSTMAPLQVTAMLDAVYGLFDDRINHYDVYKVETIGDAYMVVSGLPRRNGIQHADQIARMALDLIGVVDGLNMPQLSRRLSVRIGIHTGPCVAGVVGSKMPRYCLFGDTVNTASRMQTSGEPQKIHITENTKKALDEIGGYNIIFRCHMEVKGKGHMSTYWLKSFLNSPQVYNPPGEVPVSAFIQL